MGSTEQMRQTFLRMSDASGVAKESLLEAGQIYFDLSSDAKGTAVAVATFAKVAKATRTPIEDISKVAFAMRQQFGILPENFQRAFSILNTGAKAGSVSLSGMGTEVNKLAAKFKDFAGSQGEQGLATVGAMLQAVTKDTKDVTDAATNIANLFAKVKARRSELRDIGVNVEEGELGSGKFKDFLQVVDMLKDARDKNFDGFNEAFGNDMQATDALESLIKQKAAVKDLIDTSLKGDSIERDYQERMRSSAEKASQAWNKFKNQVAGVFTPEVLAQISGALSTIVNGISRLVEFMGGAQNAVLAFVAAWAALKALNLTVFLAQLAGQLTAVAAANAAAGGGGLLGKAAKGGGLLAGAGAVAGAGMAGYAVGTALDNAFGISDKIAGVGDFRDPVHEAYKQKMRVKQEAAAKSGGTTIAGDTINVYASTTEAKALARAVYEEKRSADLRKTAAAVGGGR